MESTPWPSPWHGLIFLVSHEAFTLAWLDLPGESWDLKPGMA